MSKIISDLLSSILGGSSTKLSPLDYVNLGLKLYEAVPHLIDPTIKQLSEDDRALFQETVAEFTRGLK